MADEATKIRECGMCGGSLAALYADGMRPCPLCTTAAAFNQIKLRAEAAESALDAERVMRKASDASYERALADAREQLAKATAVVEAAFQLKARSDFSSAGHIITAPEPSEAWRDFCGALAVWDGATPPQAEQAPAVDSVTVAAALEEVAEAATRLCEASPFAYRLRERAAAIREGKP